MIIGAWLHLDEATDVIDEVNRANRVKRAFRMSDYCEHLQAP